MIETPEQDVELRLEAIRRVKFYVEQANKTLGIHMKHPRVIFSIRGTTAGRAHYPANIIEFNPVLLRENVEDFLTQTAGHEVAHIAAYLKFGRDIDPHGFEWGKVMWCLRLPAKRCHNYDTSNVSTRFAQVRRAKPQAIVEEDGTKIRQVGIGRVIEFD